ncbi:23S rRNA (uracil(1939)-C(5))-methyltransferase [Vibrio sp. 10N.286.49.B3]|uniref:23S rRNA (uracil(1939)-C(5))-methyltransferase RlmD n=1 Tax=Vibrio sp. 10N.286.49.B3 TaxID=1880855 RepID=UPI000C816DAD|nr:23S rRNA (uracil(1939)-C(5))-methyltransferase RlmD [Vibrio sp. 10N.286.49.B3]PMH43840.1 23S rRNA (uracil(1939)-C(5))-methyltransferase [Vibrio sp. 10N.286.49.B3]
MARFFQPKKKTQFETKHQSVLVERMDHQGAGIAYLNKKPTFIDGALPGEQVVMQLTETKSKYARGQLIKILQASEDRLQPLCPVFDECGGCHLQHLAYPAQVAHKSQSLTQAMSKIIAGDEVVQPAILGDDQGYRRRTRISLFFDRKTQKLKFGFRKKQSKAIVDISECAVLAQPLQAMLPALKACLTNFSSPSDLGHLELVLGDQGPVIVLRHLRSLAAKDQQALLALAQENQASLYLMPESDQLELIHGEEASYSEAGVTIPFSPSNFIQVNQAVNKKMVAQAIEWLNPQSDQRVLDLFCGLGNFSLPLAKLAKQVVGIEGVEAMVCKAKQNAQLNHFDNVEFYQANLEEALSDHAWADEKFDKVLLDPARAGASGIVEQLASLGAKSVVYVSCNPATLARDSLSLLEQGYQLKKLGMLDMFPHTSHLEAMALFEKKGQ